MSQPQPLALLLAGAPLLAALLGCPAVEPSPAPCAHDWECTVGQVCGAGATCVAAQPGQERAFGAAALDFSDSAAEFTLAVYSLPPEGSVDSANELTSVTLAEGSSSGGAQQLWLARRFPTAVALAQTWGGRLAFEQARHERIARRLSAGQPASGAPKQAACPTCDPGQVCVRGSCTASTSFGYFNAQNTLASLDADLLAQHQTAGHAVALFVDQDDLAGVTANEAQQIADDFGTIAGPRDRAFFAATATHSGALDHDGNGAMLVLMSSKLCDLGVVGYFDDRDLLASGASGASGNEADILWVRPLGATGSCAEAASQELVLGTMAHEYQHLISHVRHVLGGGQQEALWLDEGLSHLAEDLTGYGASNIPTVVAYLEAFNDVSFSTSYPMTGSTAAQHVAMRGGAYLFLRWLFEQRGGATYGSATASVSGGGVSFLQGLLGGTAQGIGNVEQASGRSLRDLMADYVVALYVDGLADLRPELQGLGFAAPITDSATGQPRGIALRDEDPRPDASGNEWTISGPPEVELDAQPFGAEGALPLGGILYHRAFGGSEAVSIEGRADAQVDVRLAAWRLR